MSQHRHRANLALSRLEERNVPSGAQLLAIAEDSGLSRVAVYSPPVDHLIPNSTDGAPGYLQRESKLLATFTPYAGFGGGVRIARGDVTGDGVDDIVTAPGFGGGSHIKVYDGSQLLNGKAVVAKEFFAFDESFRGGVFVAAGQMDPARDQLAIIVGAGERGGPHVRVFHLGHVAWLVAPPSPQDYYSVQLQTEFFAFDAGFRGGVRVAAGDVNGDGRDELVAAAGPGGGPHVRVFDVPTPGPTVLIPYSHKVIDEFYAYDANFRGGVYVAAGNLLGDAAHAEVVTGPGVGGGPHVKVFAQNSGGKLALKNEAFADYTDEGQGARVGIIHINTDPNVDSLDYPTHSIYVGFGSREPRPVIAASEAAVVNTTAIFPFGEHRIGGFDYRSGNLVPTSFALPFGLGGDERQGLFAGV